MSGLQLDSTVLTEACPCTDCRFREKCASERRACAAFSMFVDGASEKRWQAAPRAPTRAVWLVTDGNKRRPGSGRPRTPPTGRNRGCLRGLSQGLTTLPRGDPIPQPLRQCIPNPSGSVGLSVDNLSVAKQAK